jgi:hypothetical protein
VTLALVAKIFKLQTSKFQVNQAVKYRGCTGSDTGACPCERRARSFVRSFNILPKQRGRAQRTLTKASAQKAAGTRGQSRPTDRPVRVCCGRPACLLNPPPPGYPSCALRVVRGSGACVRGFHRDSGPPHDKRCCTGGARSRRRWWGSARQNSTQSSSQRREGATTMKNVGPPLRGVGGDDV